VLPSPVRSWRFAPRVVGVVARHVGRADAGGMVAAKAGYATRRPHPIPTRRTTMATIWLYSETVRSGQRFDANAIVDYDVEATDGHIGKIDEASASDTDRSHIVVDTGFWIFGKKRLIPAGVVKQVDHDERKVWVSMTKDEIKEAPDYREDWSNDDDTRAAYEGYYGRWGW
jgi:hypothetical protein